MTRLPDETHHPALSPPAGEARSGRPTCCAVVNDLLRDKGLLLRKGTVGGRHADRRADLDQERRGRARPGDAPDQEGQPVVLRHEGPHRRGCRVRAWCTRVRRHGGQRQRRDQGPRRCCTARSTAAFADAGYQGVDKRAGGQAASSTWHVAMRPGKRRRCSTPLMRADCVDEQVEQIKASMRAKVEHPFRVHQAAVRVHARCATAAWRRTRRSSSRSNAVRA